MRFLVFGAGAMGSLFAAALAGKHEVAVVARRAHVDAIRRSGLRVSGRTELSVAVEAFEDASGAPTPDVVLVTVKSYDTPEAVRALEPFWPDALFLSLQNGLGNLERLGERAARVLGGVTYHGVTSLGPGEIRHAGEGATVIGPFQGTSLGEAESVARALSECGLPTSVSEDVRRVLWIKAVVNACFNPITGLLRARSGTLVRSAELMECSAMIVDEAVRVAAGRGIPLDASHLLERVREVSLATAENRSSMLQDLEKGRPTEIDAINGAIARMGAELGLECPVNRLLWLLVKAAEERAGGRD